MLKLLIQNEEQKTKKKRKKMNKSLIHLEERNSHFWLVYLYQNEQNFIDFIIFCNESFVNTSTFCVYHLNELTMN